ncbi:MAG: hypothetical protein L0Z73_12375, partial [Gammaproteobacteria bacterium]|nr:hypothetical protein [Gammaproteobacteria bacterium]
YYVALVLSCRFRAAEIDTGFNNLDNKMWILVALKLSKPILRHLGENAYMDVPGRTLFGKSAESNAVAVIEAAGAEGGIQTFKGGVIRDSAK